MPFGVLVIVTATLLATNVWAAIEERQIVDAAARNYLRAYTASATPDLAARRGELAARSTASARGIDSDQLTIDRPRTPFGPCQPVEVTIAIEHPALRLPFIGGAGATTIASTQRELIQPFGDATPPDPTSPFTGTPCDA